MQHVFSTLLGSLGIGKLGDSVKLANPRRCYYFLNLPFVIVCPLFGEWQWLVNHLEHTYAPERLMSRLNIKYSTTTGPI